MRMEGRGHRINKSKNNRYFSLQKQEKTSENGI